MYRGGKNCLQQSIIQKENSSKKNILHPLIHSYTGILIGIYNILCIYTHTDLHTIIVHTDFFFFTGKKYTYYEKQNRSGHGSLLFWRVRCETVKATGRPFPPGHE